jgi:hypothetical protein
MNQLPKGLVEGVADGEPPLAARIAVVHEELEGLRARLAVIATEQEALATASVPISEQDHARRKLELGKLRKKTEEKLALLSGFAAKLERDLSR